MKLTKTLFCLTFCFIIIKAKGQYQVPQYLDCVKINHLYRKACHNCFEHKLHYPTFYDALDETRVVELDIHSHNTYFSEAPTGVWYVRHSQVFSTNNNNNCGTGNKNFNICLEDVQQWSIDHSGHDPIIIFLDLKQKSPTGGDFWRPSHSTTDLDNVLRQFALDMGGLDVVYKPSDLKGGFSELRFAAFNENWPSLGNLNNKFIFVLTGDNEDLDEYLTNVGGGAMAFVAASPSGNNPSFNDLMYPSNISANNWKDIVFYNLHYDQMDDAQSFIPNNGFISRSYKKKEDLPLFGNPNTSPQEYDNNIYWNVNNIALWNVWNNTLNPNMNSQLIGINYITVAGTPQYPMYIDSYYDNILQHALIKVTTKDLIVNPGTTYNIRAGQEVELLPGTDLRAGSNVTISIGNCADYANNLRIGNTSNGNQNGASEKKEIDADSNFPKQDNSITKEIPFTFITYPNPTTDVVNISYKYQSLASVIFTLHDISGRIIKTKTYQPQQKGVQNFKINVQELRKGTYFYTLQIDKQIYNGKIIKIGY